ncbi:MAG: trypsin-like peptidase domain-containing protein [Symploca sp. SIO2C1]|nr:trypsin-like peptidase domain-containing protein [Symploca sp. SIO2C1]
MKKNNIVCLTLLGFFTALILILTPNFKVLSQTTNKVLSQNEIEAIAKMTVVFHAPLINRTKEDSLKDLATKKYIEDRIGSGVIIAKRDDVYYALTNVHVLEPKCGNHLIARDSKKSKRKEQEGIHIIPERPYNGSQEKCDENFEYFGNYDYTKNDYIDGFDLAIIKFTSKRNYFTISIDSLDSIQQNDKVFVFGFPIPEFQENRDSGDVVMKSTSGTVKSLEAPNPNGGYDFAYTNPTVSGMSGGLVLNEQGYLVGIHAAEAVLGNKEKGGQGIRIKHFLDIIEQGNSLISLSELNFNPPSQELIDAGKENDGVIESIDEILFLCPEIENKTPLFMETER